MINSSTAVEAQSYYLRVTEQGHVRTPREQIILDAFARAGIGQSTQINDDSLPLIAKQLTTDVAGLSKSLKGGCPFGHDLKPAQAKV